MNEDRGDEGKEVAAVFKRLADAANRGDKAAWIDLWSPDAILMEPDVPALQDRQAIEFGIDSWFTEQLHEICICCRNIQVTGSLAFVTGSVTDRSLLRSGDDGYRFFDGKYLAVLLRDGGGSWKIWRYCENSSVPQPREILQFNLKKNS
jgi:ketosteroid isomerase-like protein